VNQWEVRKGSRVDENVRSLLTRNEKIEKENPFEKSQVAAVLSEEAALAEPEAADAPVVSAEAERVAEGAFGLSWSRSPS